MRLIEARVENFKSVEDSGPFGVDAVTCLVGKNESGKTALLEALYKLNPDVSGAGDFNDLEYPRMRLSEYQDRQAENPDNVLTTRWKLDAEDRQAVAEDFGGGALMSDEITITKGYSNRRSWTVSIDNRAIVNHVMQAGGLFGEEQTKYESATNVGELRQLLEAQSPRSTREETLLTSVKKTFKEHSTAHDAVRDILVKRLPKFVYFAEYYRLPGRVSINDLVNKKNSNTLTKNDRVFLALLALVGKTPEQVQQIGRTDELIAQLEAISNRISRTIFAYWSQNKHLSVQFRFEQGRPNDPAPFNSGFVFHTRVYNRRHEVSVSFDERSTGFIWFFSFLIWFSQVQREYGENVVILLDEPGLTLHARAQADLLRYINEQLRPNYQVIYTTHSPFMVDANDLLAVRTVEDVVEDDRVLGTRVGEKVLSADTDTVFPLQAALSYDISQTLFIGLNTLLVEGPSDLLYVKWFQAELARRGRTTLDDRWVVCPVGGIAKIETFAALLGGNKLHIAVLADYKHGDKNKVRALKQSNLLPQGHVFSAETYADQAEADVEDMLGRQTYIALVNAAYALSGGDALPKKKPTGAPVTVVDEVSRRFATLPPEAAGFDHSTPAKYLFEHRDVAESLPGMDAALDRFERFFTDLNALLPPRAQRAP